MGYKEEETGRAGRDNNPSEVILYPMIKHPVTQGMKLYYANDTECRRSLLLQDFLFYNNVIVNAGICWDICCIK